MSAEPADNTTTTDLPPDDIPTDPQNQADQNQTSGDPIRDDSTSNIQEDLSKQIRTLEKLLNKSKKDLESMVIKYARSESENLQNKNKVDDLDKKLKRSMKDNESLANRIRILTNDKNSITDTLNAKLAQLTVLEQKNNSLCDLQSDKFKELKEKCAKLEEDNGDLLKQIDTYKLKEGELLDFSERLSMKQLLLQTELDKALEKSPDYKQQFEEAKDDNVKQSQQLEDCRNKIEELSARLIEEANANTQLREEISSLEVKYCRRIDELENEMKVMRRKHQIAAKEIYRQMKQISLGTQEQRQPSPIINS